MREDRQSYFVGGDPAAAERHLRILLVDDDPLICVTLADAAERAGFETATAGTGREALERAGAESFDLAVLDHGLPDCSGTALARSLRRTRHLPFLFLTARSDDATVAEAAELGALGYLVKPFDAAALGPALRVACAQAAGRGRALEHERRRLASELHDGLGQELAAASLMAAAIESKSRRGAHPADQEFAQLRQTLEQAQRHCRDLSRREYPTRNCGCTLGPALQALALSQGELNGVICDYEGPVGPTPSIPDIVGHHLYRIAQEALHNATRHSGGSRIAVRLILESRAMALSIRDDGKGCGSLDCGGGRGIGCRTMRDRAFAIGGTLTVRDASPGGTEVLVEVPL